MVLFYTLSLLPLLIGAGLFLLNRNVNWVEWVAGFLISLLTAAIFHALVIAGMTDDIQTFSGQIEMAKQFSRWQEYYEYAVYRTEYYTTTETDSDGHSHTVTHSREVFDHWEPTTTWHEEYFKSYSNISTEYAINKSDFEWYIKIFNDKQSVKGSRSTFQHNSRMIAGDPNDYEAHNKTGYVSPITATRHWKNKVRACPSVFSYIKVPTNAPVFSYPKNQDPFNSDRLLGEAQRHITLLNFDQMNARLGPKKRVNVIMVGFKGDSSLSQLQESKWIGGKKNDLVITYACEGRAVKWVRVFGWTELDICKRNIENIFLENPVNNDILPKVEEEIKENYIIKDWTKFDYLSVEPPPWSYLVYVFILVATQIGFWIFAINNEYDKS